MVNQISPMSSTATDVAPVLVVSAKPQSVQESTQPEKVAGRTAKSSVSESTVPRETEQDLDSAVKEFSSNLKQSGSDLEIQWDKASGRNVVKVVDPRTGGVVLQFPPEEVLAMARKLRETAKALDISGVLVDREG